MKKFSRIKDIINDAKKGKLFILVDNKDRENEGDRKRRKLTQSIDF